MEHLKDLYVKNSNVVKQLLEEDVVVTLKIDGSAFQISNEDNEIVYRKRSGSPTKPGPVIDEFSLMFINDYCDAISFFENKYKILKKYKFLTFEIFNKHFILLSGISLGGKIIEYEELKDISNELGCDLVPVIFSGKLDNNQKSVIFDYLDGRKNNFEQTFFDIFDMSSVTDGDILEGFVFTFKLSSKEVSYKIVNPKYTEKVLKNKEDKNIKAEKYKKETNELILRLITEVDKKVNDSNYKKSNNYWDSLNVLFLDICNSDSKIFNELLILASKLPISNFPPNKHKMLRGVYNLYNKFGDPFRNLYEVYCLTFHKERKRNYIIDKETQIKINNLINNKI